MQNTKKYLIAGILCASLTLVSVALAASSPDLTRWVIGGGGGYLSSGNTALSGTIGQPVVGVSSNADITLSHGFWFSPAAENVTCIIYLPLVKR